MMTDSSNVNRRTALPEKMGSKGFTLIELMITVVVLGILVSISYPSYLNYTKRTRRSDAMAALTQAANQQERFFTECNWYAANVNGARSCVSNTAGVLGFTNALSPDGHYLISIAAGTLGPCAALTCGYTLVADPNGTGTTTRQKDDGKYRIDSTGRKQWDKANDNTYTATWTDR